MAGSQKAALEEKARGVLAAMGMPGMTAVGLRIGRPAAARLEIVHPVLRDCRPSDRWDQMKMMLSDGTAPAVILELAQMTRGLREAGIRATADYKLGSIVVSWGKPRQPDVGEIRRSLARSSGGEPVSENLVLVTWAEQPVSEADVLGPALGQAMGVIAPAYADRPRGTAKDSRRKQPGTSSSRLRP